MNIDCNVQNGKWGGPERMEVRGDVQGSRRPIADGMGNEILCEEAKAKRRISKEFS